MPTKALPLQAIITETLENSQAIDPIVLDVHALTSITDTMIICSGRSTRHVQSIAENIIVQAKKNHVSYLHTEGDKDSEWVLVDMGDIVVHIMLPAIRTTYSLEALWTSKELYHLKKTGTV